MIENPEKASRFLRELGEANVVARLGKLESLIEESGLEKHLAEARAHRAEAGEESKPAASAEGKN